MSLGELLVIGVVAMMVFGPKKLPMLANHLGKLYYQCLKLNQKARTVWEDILAEQQLLDNQARAEKADTLYQKSERAPPSGSEIIK